jgi:hypothetical protein
MWDPQTSCSRARMATVFALLVFPTLLCAYPGKHLHLEQLVQSSVAVEKGTKAVISTNFRPFVEW